VGATSHPEHPTTVTAAAERKRERRTMSPPRSPPLVVSREPRRQAAQRAQPGPCARRTAVESLDASSRDQRVRGVDAKSEGGAEAKEHVPAPTLLAVE
jgi:hypothetical protein